MDTIIGRWVSSTSSRDQRDWDYGEVIAEVGQSDGERVEVAWEVSGSRLTIALDLVTVHDDRDSARDAYYEARDAV